MITNIFFVKYGFINFFLKKNIDFHKVQLHLWKWRFMLRTNIFLMNDLKRIVEIKSLLWKLDLKIKLFFFLIIPWKNFIDILLIQLFSSASNESITFIFISYHIAILYPISDSNKLMTYLFWSPMKTIHFFRCV